MKQQVFYIHGGTAYSNYQVFLENLKQTPVRDLPSSDSVKNWSSTLREDLGEDYEVFTPSMPNKQNAKYLEWKIWFERYFPYLRDGLILVGWSQGGYFLSKYLIENPAPVAIKALILIAAPFQPDNFDGEDGGDFTFDTAQAGQLAKKTEAIYLLHSTDDPIVPYAHARNYQQALPNARIVTFSDKNHFFQSDFPQLLELIRSVG